MAQFFINRPIVAMVMSIIITLAGLVAMNRLPIAQLPEIVPPQIQVSTTYTGADAVTVEQAFPLLIISFISPNGTYDFNFLGNYATINVIDALKRIPGVGDVQARGTSDYAMRIWVKPDQIARLGLTVTDLQNAIQKQNTVNPAGQVGGEPALPGE